MRDAIKTTPKPKANGPIVAPRPAPGTIGGRGKKREKKKGE